MHGSQEKKQRKKKKLQTKTLTQVSRNTKITTRLGFNRCPSYTTRAKAAASRWSCPPACCAEHRPRNYRAKEHEKKNRRTLAGAAIGAGASSGCSCNRGSAFSSPEAVAWCLLCHLAPWVAVAASGCDDGELGDRVGARDREGAGCLVALCLVMTMVEPAKGATNKERLEISTSRFASLLYKEHFFFFYFRAAKHEPEAKQSQLFSDRGALTNKRCDEQDLPPQRPIRLEHCYSRCAALRKKAPRAAGLSRNTLVAYRRPLPCTIIGTLESSGVPSKNRPPRG